MDKICYGKWTAWIAPVVMLLLSLFYVITAQPDFLSISCGAKTNHTADNNITWITDAHYIDVGQSEDIGDLSEIWFLNDQTYGSSLRSLRYFPEPLNKSCYQLPVVPDVPYLLRLWFPPVGQVPPSNFTFSIETVDMLAQQDVTISELPILHEFILATKGRELYICLVRSDYTDPSISAIEMRRLQEDMYIDAQPGTILVTLSRYDVGGNSTVRYPQDKFDRIWRSDLEASSDLYSISSKEPISTNNAHDLPPTAVLQTAWVVNNPQNITLQSWEPSVYADRTLLLLYFAEIERLNMSQSRSFSVSVDGVLQRETITLSRNYSAQEFTIYPDTAPNLLDLLKSSDSTLPPIINAFECYGVYLSDQATESFEIDALNAIKSRFDIKDWISHDPCYLIPWDGISCDNSSISELNLSGRNLTGAVPGDIAQLNSLVTLSLADNHLTGPVPDLTNLVKLEGLSLDHNGFTGPLPITAYPIELERSNLQNNNLNGTLEWLPTLENLREVSLNDNQFTGPMPILVTRDKLERL